MLPFTQNQIDKFKRKYGEEKQNLVKSGERDDNQMTSWVRHEDQRRDQETPRAQQHFGRAQEILTIQQEAGDNYFVVEHAPQLNRSCKGPELEIINIEKNFSPNSFEVNEMNDKNILDTCVHNNCSRYHSETRGQTNTPRISFEKIAVNKNGDTTEI